MRLAPKRCPSIRRLLRPAVLVAGFAILAGSAAGAGEAAVPVGIAIPPLAGFSPVSESGPRWSSLSAAHREALKPLEEDWAQIDGSRKQKWLEIAARFPSLSVAERQRLHERMADWARLSPAQRGEVRLNFQQASRTPAAERQAQWQAYQALPADEKSRLASRAAEASKPPTRSPAAASIANRGESRVTPGTAPKTATIKSNLVPNPLFTTAPRTVGPTLVRPGPGATTTLVNRPPKPPLHQQPGLPKVAATPVMVDPTTLLPQRGPQAAAVIATATMVSVPAAAASAPAAATSEAAAAAAPAVAASAPAPAPAGPPYSDTSIGER